MYSWVPAVLRMWLVRGLAAATVPGALVYMSYNTLPGWTSAIPLQHMLHRLQECSSRSGPAIISQGAELFAALIAARAGVVQAMPPLPARVDALRRQAPAYLVQEYRHHDSSEKRRVGTEVVRKWRSTRWTLD